MGLECRFFFAKEGAGLVCCRALPAKGGVIVNPLAVHSNVEAGKFRANAKVFFSRNHPLRQNRTFSKIKLLLRLAKGLLLLYIPFLPEAGLVHTQ